MILTHIILFSFLAGAGGVIAAAAGRLRRGRAQQIQSRLREIARSRARRAKVRMPSPEIPEKDLPFVLAPPAIPISLPPIAPFDLPNLPGPLTRQLSQLEREREEEEMIARWAIG